MNWTADFLTMSLTASAVSGAKQYLTTAFVHGLPVPAFHIAWTSASMCMAPPGNMSPSWALLAISPSSPCSPPSSSSLLVVPPSPAILSSWSIVTMRPWLAALATPIVAPTSLTRRRIVAAESLPYARCSSIAISEVFAATRWRS